MMKFMIRREIYATDSENQLYNGENIEPQTQTVLIAM
jgi:hypothetical protein